jgi:molybdenum cofactor cytidylyltransferase
MTGIVILAAGESKRLGQPKQNLLFKGKTLLQNAIDAALGSPCSPVIVVLGANADLILPTITQQDITILQNSNWQEGMASSFRIAIAEMIKHGVEQTIVMLCDQPFVDSELLDSLLRQQKETGKAIVACHYNNTAGVPVLFDKGLFPELLLLVGQEGAKKILAGHSDVIAIVEFEKGSVDIDTIGDYEGLIIRLL